MYPITRRNHRTDQIEIDGRDVTLPLEDGHRIQIKNAIESKFLKRILERRYYTNI